MAAGQYLVDFDETDRFLRRVRFADHMRRGLLHWRAFKEKERTLSWTLQDDTLRSDGAIDEYRKYWSSRINDGTIPGIIWISHLGLTRLVEPPLSPQHAPDIVIDPKYGHLHCTTDVPDKQQMEVLAKIVNDGDHGEILRVVVAST